MVEINHSETSEEPKEVLDIGTILTVDNEGYLVSQSRIENIVEPWDAPIEDVKKVLLDDLGEDVHSIYIRGSIPRGTAVEGVSDIDGLVVLKEDISEKEVKAIKSKFKEVNKKYPFITGIDMATKTIDEINDPKSKVPKFLLKCLSACVYGEDLIPELPPVKPGRDSLTLRWWFDKPHLEKKIKLLEDKSLDIDVKQQCKWVTKNMLRLGMELVSEDAQAYSRDLTPCYKLFSRFHPEKEKDMKKTLELAINPTDNSEEILRILKGQGSWLVDELDKKYPK